MVMPRYQRAGIQISGMPQVTTAGLQESARTAQTLSQAMDRVSSFAFKQAATQAEIEGKEFGALNAPTVEQIAAAKSTGGSLEDLVPGDRGTIFGRAARGVALDSVTTAMELEARKSVVELEAQYEAGDISLVQLQTGLESISEQQTSIMREISPLAAQKFSASIGVVSNAAYLGAAKKEAVRARKDLEIQYRAGVDTLMRNAESIVRAGDTLGEDGGIVTVDQKIQLIRDQITVAAQELDDPNFYQTKIKELDAAVTQAKIGVVMDEGMINPAVALRVFQGEGKFEDSEVQATFESMTNAERRELRNQLRSALSEDLSLASARESATERKRAKQSESIQADVVSALVNGDQEGAIAALDRLRDVDEGAYASKAAAVYADPGKDDRETVVALRQLALRNELTAVRIDSAMASGQLSMERYKEFMGDLENQQNQKYNKAIIYLRGNRGLPDVPLINAAGVNRQAQQEVAQIKNALIDAINDDPSIDPLTFIKQQISELETEEGDLGNVALRQEADRLAEELRVLLPGASAQELLNAITNDTSLYPNPQRRAYATETLLPLLIQIEARNPQ